MEKKTCLYDAHVALGAKMEPFGGFIMPIQYSSIVDEHLAVRTSCGAFDVSHMGEIWVSGPDAENFVNHVFTGNVTGMESGRIQYGMLLYPDGCCVDDLLVYKEQTSGEYLLVVNAANIEKDWQWLLQCSDGYDVKIDNRSDSWGQIAVQGPDAEKIVTGLLGLSQAGALSFYTYCDAEYEGKRLIVSRTGYTGEDGFELYCTPGCIVTMWNKLIEAGVKPCGLGCRDTLRFEAGMPLYGHELSDKVTPVQAGLGMFVKLDKEEFIGRDALLAQKAEGPETKLVGIEIFDRAIPRGGYPVLDENENVIGEVTTGYHSISLDRSICMAYVAASHAALDTPVKIQIRKKVFDGKVIKKRFYQTNYKK
ncbi:MAG: glycine cleavage system aminomethyltransferase GcvT [Bacteroidales bacterium]|nr:glycine cleavage system aminomethyltransferase GcvT [Bacteroidales bacterium]